MKKICTCNYDELVKVIGKKGATHNRSCPAFTFESKKDLIRYAENEVEEWQKFIKELKEK